MVGLAAARRWAGRDSTTTESQTPSGSRLRMNILRRRVAILSAERGVVNASDRSNRGHGRPLLPDAAAPARLAMLAPFSSGLQVDEEPRRPCSTASSFRSPCPARGALARCRGGERRHVHEADLRLTLRLIHAPNMVNRRLAFSALHDRRGRGQKRRMSDEPVLASYAHRAKPYSMEAAFRLFADRVEHRAGLAQGRFRVSGHRHDPAHVQAEEHTSEGYQAKIYRRDRKPPR